MSPWEVNSTDLLHWGSSFSWKPETRRQAYSSVRKFYSWAHGAGYVDINPALQLPRVKESQPAPHPCPEEMMKAAIANAPADVALMMSLASYLGLRRGEVARVNILDVIEDLSGYTLIVHGKGGKTRTVPMDVCLAHDVIEVASKNIGGWLFPGKTGHITPGTVGKKVAKALPDGWTMHSLRHRFGTVAYHETRDIMAVQKILGHSSPKTTQRYIAIDAERLRTVVMSAR